jgi:LDH2 family malate/lactate/ureidoglycolate dehydrogenase
VQVFDPEAFGGLAAFQRQASFLAAQCLGSPPIDLSKPVRLPGARALANLARARREGLSLYPGILEALGPLASRRGIALPGNASGAG